MSVCLILIVLSAVADNVHPETHCVFESQGLGRAIQTRGFQELRNPDDFFSIAEHHRMLRPPKPAYLPPRISHTNPVPKETAGLSSPGEGRIELRG